MHEHIRLRISEGIATISITRPEAFNALSRDIVDVLDGMLEEIENNDNVSVLVFYSDQHFAAGADIKQMSICNPEEARTFLFTDTYNKIASLPMPTIAAINGYTFGGGLELALCCDLRIAAKSASIGLTELNLGIMPGAGGTVRLPRLIGEARAKEMILLSKVIDGIEAERIGLSNKVVEDDQLEAEVYKIAAKLQKKSLVSIKAAKASIANGLAETDVIKATHFEADTWVELFNSYDQKEGMKAFIEKRKPKFLNR